MRVPFFQAGILMALLPVGAAAQMHHVDTPERVTRAVGVYEWVGELGKPAAARLVPVTLFINGRTEDAGTYLARPVPFALETGNLYAVEFAGLPKGTLNVMMARDVASAKSEADDNPEGNWYGYGLFELPKPVKASTLKPSVVVPQLTATGDDDRPHFVAPRPQVDTSAGERRAAAGAKNDDDPEKPTLGKRDPDAAPEKDKKKKQKPAGYVTGLPNGLNDDPDRPTLGRGKTGVAQTPPLTGLPKEMKQAVAVSDAVSVENHEFSREWENADEHQQALAGVQKIATAAVKDYLAANGLVAAKDGEPALTPVTAATSKVVAKPGAPHRRAAVKVVETPLVLGDERLVGLQLSYGGLPTFVYSAATMGQQAKAGAGPLQVQVFVTVVAQRLPSGELQVALKSVTDDAHLSRVPWMRFVDAVDPDGSHRASLLYELRGKSSRQFALYRLVSAQAEQTFATGLLE